MRLVFDVQGAQATNRFRGIGRYVLELVKAMLRTRGHHEVVFMANGAFEESVEALRAEIKDLAPANTIRVWMPPQPCRALENPSSDRVVAAKLAYETFANSLKPDVFLIGSVFDGFVDDAAISIGRLPRRCHVAAVLFDLIPLIHANVYLDGNERFRTWYTNQLSELRKADALLAISKSSAQEAVEYLNWPAHRVHPIMGACSSQFRRIGLGDSQCSELLARFGINRPFLMYTGGIDYRKNIEGLISAYARLPLHIRQSHQLAIVCHADAASVTRLQNEVRLAGLHQEEVIFTGFVSDEELVKLYNACKVFIFPSWHEGFGLPALEAMACGRAVLASNTTSLPEIVGRADALFDPYDPADMARVITRALTDDAFRAELEAHALKQSAQFSWDRTAERAWRALERLVESDPPRRQNADATENSISLSVPAVSFDRRPRLAYVSPVPPAASGIADYSAELLPALARHYDIEIIAQQAEAPDPLAILGLPVRTPEWLMRHATEYDRVLYQVGNSGFHSYMFSLQEQVPGVVVLHDVFLADLHRWDEFVDRRRPGAWTEEILYAEGWSGLTKRIRHENPEFLRNHPCCLRILQNALGVIVHSEHAKSLLERHYPALPEPIPVIPQLRALPKPGLTEDKAAAKAVLGFDPETLLVSTFGIIGQPKLPERLLEAWRNSRTGRNPKARLVYVGLIPKNEWANRFSANARRVRNVLFTGRVAPTEYRRWLEASDIAVQLRSSSRGETSRAVLDCVAHGLAVIVNRHGTMAELPPDAVVMIDEAASIEALSAALDQLHESAELRRMLGERGRAYVQEAHAPERCTKALADAVEHFYAVAEKGPRGAIRRYAMLASSLSFDDADRFAQALALNHPPHSRRPQCLIDVSELVRQDVKSGIQRVTRAILKALLEQPPGALDVQPVYATTNAEGYRYARRFTANFLDLSAEGLDDEVVEAHAGDVFFALDLQPQVLPAQQRVLTQMRTRGVKTLAVVYDLLPIRLPHTFVDGAAVGHHRWLETVSQLDGALCISRAVADELETWLNAHGRETRALPFEIHWFHLGADIDQSVPTRGIPAAGRKLLARLPAGRTFLMVGTLEPRKGHRLVLEAFDRLWRVGYDVHLVIVGKQGWMVETLAERIRQHAEHDKRLHWLQGISDEFLEGVYGASSCLIAASEGEGFGLPLVEAARYNLPILARDIPVFREVAGDGALYFPADASPRALARVLRETLKRLAEGDFPSSGQYIHPLPWAEAAVRVRKILLGQIEPYKQWLPTRGRRLYHGNDPRLGTQVGERRGWGIHNDGRAGHLLHGPYVKLPRGSYRVRFTGVARNTVGSELLDIASRRGEEVHTWVILPAGLRGEWTVEYVLSLEDSVDYLETRVWVDEDSDLTIFNIEITDLSQTHNVH